jgi:hypothetical protein
MTLSLDSFALKIVKKAEELAFSSKAKIINISIPEKVKNFIETNLAKDMDYFERKYKLKFNLISDKNLILPEYKIELLNRNNKIIKKIENIDQHESNFMWQKFKKKEFNNKKFIGKNKYNKRFGYRSKTRRSGFDNKKSIGY